MNVIADIFDALGEATVIAAALNEPVQTVHSWKSSGSIPRWRRERLLTVEPVPGKSLSASALQYLRSTAKRPEQVPASQQAAA